MNPRTTPTARGRLIAAILAGSWRTAATHADLAPAALAEITPFLLRSGAGALAWRRVRGSDLADAIPAHELRHAALLHGMQAEVNLSNLVRLLKFLSERGLEPLLIKGWSVSRLYPAPALRPYGDFDLVFPPGTLAESLGALTELGNACGPLDLHDGMPDLTDRRWSEIWSRSKCVELEGTMVRVLGLEDQLRQQCLHLLRHGAWRPLWFCDVGAALESAGADFDFEYCLLGEKTASDWVRAVIGLTCQLLEARGSAFDVGPPPAWLAEMILDQWGRGECGDSHSRDATPFLQHWRHPFAWGRALRSRWPNPIEAAIEMRQAPHSRVPRPLLQSAVVLCRAGSLLWHLPDKILAGPATPAATIHQP
jgi:hypothetical protein